MGTWGMRVGIENWGWVECAHCLWEFVIDGRSSNPVVCPNCSAHGIVKYPDIIWLERD